MGKRKGRRKCNKNGSGDENSSEPMYATIDRAGLKVHHVDPDGDCLFRAFASQFYGDEEKHHEVRDSCCDYVQFEDPNFFESFLEDQNLLDYVSDMRKTGTWGTQLEIVALCRRYHVDCVIFRPDGLHYRIECDKPDCEEVRIIMLSHHDEEHFNEVRFKEKGKVISSSDELELLLSSNSEVRRKRGSRILAPQVSRIVDI